MHRYRISMPVSLDYVQNLENNQDDPLTEINADTEELLPNKEVLVPATPGSVYGGSRNIMKNSINQTVFHKYIFNQNIMKTNSA